MPLPCLGGFIRLQGAAVLFPQGIHDCLIGRVPAHDGPALIVHGGGVPADGKPQLRREHRLSREEIGTIDRPIRRKKLDHREPSARDCPRFIAKENVQRPRRLDADGAAHEHAA